MKCPHCGEETVAKKKTLRSGFQAVGEIEVCALCGKELKTEKKPETARGDHSADRLSALLGGVKQEKITIDPGEAHGSFCRNCKNFLIHPFRTVCALSGKDADPQYSCEKFEKRMIK